MSEVTYCIPTALVDAYRGRSVVVRAAEARALARSLPSEGFDGLEYVRLTCVTGDSGPLRRWGRSIPVDLTMSSPPEQFPELYKWAGLLDTRPVRVSMPAVPGFGKAVKLAASLHFSVKIDPGQPRAPAVAEMLEVLDFYLHHEAVTQPIEFFQSVLMAFCRQEAASMWGIQEEDPSEFRDVADDGTEAPPARLAELGLMGPLEQRVEQFEQTLLARDAECARCEFRAVCHGYFKAPSEAFACDGVKTIFGRLKLAAAELKRDIAAKRPAGRSGDT